MIKTPSVTFVKGIIGIAYLLTSLVMSTAAVVPLLQPRRDLQPSASGAGDSYAPSLSADGRYVFFASHAKDLVPETASSAAESIHVLNLFRRDREAKETVLITQSLSGEGADGDTFPLGMSSDGRWILFESDADDLVDGDTNSMPDIFLRDMLSRSNALVSVSTNGGSASGASTDGALTRDGRFVVFVSEAPDVVPGDTNGISDIFVRDLQLGVTSLESVAQENAPETRITSNGMPSLTSDARYVAFISEGTNSALRRLILPQLFIRDRTAQETIPVSQHVAPLVYSALGSSNVFCPEYVMSDAGNQVVLKTVLPDRSKAVVLGFNLATRTAEMIHGNGAVNGGINLTPDGRFIAFVARTNSEASLPPSTCVLVKDTVSGALTLASGDLSGAVPAGSECDWPVMDDGGRYVAFFSTATGFVTNELTSAYNLYVRDLQQGATYLLNVDAAGRGGELSSLAAPSISADGRVLAFEAPDGSLVSHDNNNSLDVFARTVPEGSLELISVRDGASINVFPDGPSDLPIQSMSRDGRFLVYVSAASNLVPNDTNNATDVFLLDLFTGSTVLVSVSTNGQVGNLPSRQASITEDGRFVAFASLANNLVPGDRNGKSDVFLRDLLSGRTTLISVEPTGVAPGRAESWLPLIGSDGRHVIYITSITGWLPAMPLPDNLVVRDLLTGVITVLPHGILTVMVSPYLSTWKGRYVVYQDVNYKTRVWDLDLGRLVQVPAAVYSDDGTRFALLGQPGLGMLFVDLPSGTTNVATFSSPAISDRPASFSSDARYVVYVSRTNSTEQVYLYEWAENSASLLSKAYGLDRPAAGNSGSPAISRDGRFVAFSSAASDLVTNDFNGTADVFLFDGWSNTVTLVSANLNGVAANRRSGNPAFTPDGNFLLFESLASDLAPNDHNNTTDIFAYRLRGPSEKVPVAIWTSRAADLIYPAISWPATPGNNYRVEFAEDLNLPEWKNLEAPSTATVTHRTVMDPRPLQGTRFYRVVTEPGTPQTD